MHKGALPPIVFLFWFCQSWCHISHCSDQCSNLSYNRSPPGHCLQFQMRYWAFRSATGRLRPADMLSIPCTDWDSSPCPRFRKAAFLLDNAFCCRSLPLSFCSFSMDIPYRCSWYIFQKKKMPRKRPFIDCSEKIWRFLLYLSNLISLNYVKNFTSEKNNAEEPADWKTNPPFFSFYCLYLLLLCIIILFCLYVKLFFFFSFQIPWIYFAFSCNVGYTVQ